MLDRCVIHGGGGGDGGGEKVETRFRSPQGEQAYVGQVHLVEQVCLLSCRSPSHHHCKGARHIPCALLMMMCASELSSRELFGNLMGIHCTRTRSQTCGIHWLWAYSL
jgi:hypothetical protein